MLNPRQQPQAGHVRGGQQLQWSSHFRLSAHKRSADFQQYVDRQIIPSYPQADFMFLIVDGSSVYRSKSTLAWLKERPQIVPVPLPSHAPKLDLQEQVWRWLRTAATHNHYFRSLNAVVNAAKRFLPRWSNSLKPYCGLWA